MVPIFLRDQGFYKQKLWKLVLIVIGKIITIKIIIKLIIIIKEKSIITIIKWLCRVW